MAEETGTKRIVFNTILGIVVLVASFLVIREGFFMDESGLLSTYKAIYQGNRMFIDSWGPFQLGGLLTYPLFASYYELLEPILFPLGIGFVLYARICYQIIRLLIAFYLYMTIRKTEYEKGAFLTALTYYAMFVSYKDFSYKSMCDFGIVLFICWLVRYFDTRNKWFFVLMGLATCVMILAYPTMILFPVIIVIGMFIFTYNGYELMKPIIIYSVTCFIVGIAVVIYLAFTSGLGNIIPQLQYLEDSAYKEPAYIRLGMMLLSYAFFFLVAYIPVVFMKLLSLRQYIDERTINIALSFYWIIFMLAVIFARPNSVSDSRLVYGYLVAMWWLPYLVNKKEKTQYTMVGHYKMPEHDGRQMLNIIFFISLTIQAIWSISTNQGVTVPGYMCMYIVLVVVMLAASEVEGLALLGKAIVVFTLFFSLFWVAESDSGYSDILEDRTFVDYGALKGIALDEADYKANESCYNLVTNYVTAEDRIFAVNGFGYTAYLNSDARMGIGSPYSRAGEDRSRILDYWEVNPENQADYILINPQNKYYSEFETTQTAAYIFENYKTEVATDGDFILLAR